ncbi:UNVERIFIED_CONTAM: protein SPA1-RELATED 3 [Sesamum radiatum]|uniref:Protein SPA1-RELATED 3 n=1 Tax=Sesamum radiatum TaxID=300843 RepID=A0AAW2T461_SESRA
MEGSHESGWQRSDSSRGLNSSSFLDRNRRVRRASTVRSSDDNTSHDSGLISGIVVHNVRPSCFIMSSFNRVSFIESASCSDSGSDSQEHGSNSQTAEFTGSASRLPSDSHLRQNSGTQLDSNGSRLMRNPVNAASQMNSEASCLQSCSGQAMHASEATGNDRAEGKKHSFPMKKYCFWNPIGTAVRKRFPVVLALMLPTFINLVSYSLSELLQSEFLNEPRDDIEEREAAIELREKIEEQELLLEFLLLLQQRKQVAADSLKETVSVISSDIEEVTERQGALRIKGGSSLDLDKNSASAPNSINTMDDDDSGSLGSRKRIRQGLYVNKPDESNEHGDEYQTLEMSATNQGSVPSKSSRLMKNFRKLEAAYFLTRRRAVKPTRRTLAKPSPISSDGRGSIAATERSSISNPSSKERYTELRRVGWVDTFLEGICKYLSFSQLKVKADLKQGDLLNSSNLVCSLSFDRDGEFFATAGINKKIKVFEYNSILNEERDIHYPVVEMSSRSKLSSICWNSYIKSQIASSNFEGVVQVWDVTRSQIFKEMREHEQRVWSIDFSVADPTMLASGSDDGSVKLWNINQAILFLHLVDVSFETKRTTASSYHCCVYCIVDV